VFEGALEDVLRSSLKKLLPPLLLSIIFGPLSNVLDESVVPLA
jgi:hypothetical protein